MNIEAKRKAVKSFIGTLKGGFYTVVFEKKTEPGVIRTMNCRQNVQKYSNGGVNPCEGKADLLPTFSVDAGGYRTINIDGIKEIRGGGQVVKFS